MGIEQKLIQKMIDNGELITQCIVTGKVKVNGYYIGFRFEKPYKNITGGLSPEGLLYSQEYNWLMRKYSSKSKRMR